MQARFLGSTTEVMLPMPNLAISPIAEQSITWLALPDFKQILGRKPAIYFLLWLLCIHKISYSTVLTILFCNQKKAVFELVSVLHKIMYMS